jgi:4-hydroxy 2-oxovalerate aldolase
MMTERQVHLIDVTLRDGGKVNDHRWTPAQAIDVVRACLRAGVPQVEVGYWRPRRQRVDGDRAPAAS